MAKIISAFVMKLENSLAILIHALRRIRLMLNFNLQRKPFMKCLQTLIADHFLAIYMLNPSHFKQ